MDASFRRICIDHRRYDAARLSWSRPLGKHPPSPEREIGRTRSLAPACPVRECGFASPPLSGDLQTGVSRGLVLRLHRCTSSERDRSRSWIESVHAG